MLHCNGALCYASLVMCYASVVMCYASVVIQLGQEEVGKENLTKKETLAMTRMQDKNA